MTEPVTILDRLLQISLLVQQDLAAAFDGTPLTTTRVHCLWELNRSEPSTQAALASALEVTPRTVTSLVDALESTGYVERRPHPTDRRAVLVALTEFGRMTMATMAREREQLAAELVGDLDARRLDRLAEDLGRIAERLDLLMAAAADGPGR
ncbi:MAG TPA: MarR family transcriptional regulator [Propionibacteriaceae bacterium]